MSELDSPYCVIAAWICADLMKVATSADCRSRVYIGMAPGLSEGPARFVGLMGKWRSGWLGPREVGDVGAGVGVSVGASVEAGSRWRSSLSIEQVESKRINK